MTATRSRRQDRVVRTQVEPRLQERRSRVADDRRRGRRRAWWLLGAVIAAIGAAVGVAYSPLFDLDHLRVEGASQLDAEALADASGLAIGDRMVQVDVGEVRASLRAVPGVRAVRVHREWPSTVRVVVSEERPAVEAHAGGRHAVLSTTGRVLAPGVLDDDGLVPLHLADGQVLERGSEAAEDVLAAAMVLYRMDERMRAEVDSASLAQGALLTLELTDGATVQFGPLENVPAKLSALEAVLAQVASECRSSIDVREPARVTVSRTCPGPPVSDGADPDSGEVEG